MQAGLPNENRQIDHGAPTAELERAAGPGLLDKLVQVSDAAENDDESKAAAHITRDDLSPPSGPKSHQRPCRARKPPRSCAIPPSAAASPNGLLSEDFLPECRVQTLQHAAAVLLSVLCPSRPSPWRSSAANRSSSSPRPSALGPRGTSSFAAGSEQQAENAERG